MLISRNVSNVSDVTLARTNASATVEAPASGAATFAGLIVSRKGRPGVPLFVNKGNYLDVLGRAYHMREGAHAEGMRHIHDAVKGGSGYVVRVLPSDARAPVLTINKKAQGALPADANPVVASSLAYGSSIALAADAILAIRLIDGDNEYPRSLSIVEADEEAYGTGFYELSLSETGASGDVQVLESHIISLDISAVGLDGRSAYIEDKIEASTIRMDVKVNLANVGDFTHIAPTAFVGGTSGTAADIDEEAYQSALAVLRNADISFTHVLGLGIYVDTVLTALQALADETATQAYVDVEPNLSYADALARRKTMGLSLPCASVYHLPYTCTDPFYGTRISYGLSGMAFLAKARGVALDPIVGGWHYPNAGESRATIERSGLLVNANAGTPDYEAMYKARLNKVGLNTAGQLMIDDSLTASPKEDYQRFEWIVSVDSVIGRQWVALGKSLKHEPEGLTVAGLRTGMSRILESFTVAGALVTPQDPADGTEPWTLTVEKVSADHFTCKWGICIAGSGRRISGQSRLIK